MMAKNTPENIQNPERTIMMDWQIYVSAKSPTQRLAIAPGLCTSKKGMATDYADYTDYEAGQSV
jgi:hypothetical protein